MAQWTRVDWSDYKKKVATYLEIAEDDVVALTRRAYIDGYIDWHLIFWGEGGSVEAIRLDQRTIDELGLNDAPASKD